MVDKINNAMYIYISLTVLLFTLAEAISVDIGFRNPLQISLSISSISLVCEHSSSSEEGEMGKLFRICMLFGVCSIFLVFFCNTLCDLS